MQGNNTLILNTTTMIEAVQLWLDSCMQKPVPTVTAVDPIFTSPTFKVTLSSDADRPSTVCEKCHGQRESALSSTDYAMGN